MTKELYFDVSEAQATAIRNEQAAGWKETGRIRKGAEWWTPKRWRAWLNPHHFGRKPKVPQLIRDLW